MKNILVVLVMLVASQVLVALAQDMNPEFNGPNDCGGLRKPIIEKIFSSANSEEDNKCGIIVEPGKSKLVESKDKEKGPNPEICFNGDCGIGDNNEISSKIIKVK